MSVCVPNVKVVGLVVVVVSVVVWGLKTKPPKLKVAGCWLSVTVGVERKHDTVEVSVADEGIGIPQSDQDQIFRKFYRGADAETRVIRFQLAP